MADACDKAAEVLNIKDFGVLDENFCKTPVRARQLLTELENRKRNYTFAIFSSAEAVTKLGVDFLVRMGVNLLWLGIESKWDVFEKTRGIDLTALIKNLQNHGISVLASTILFLDHHDKDTIEEDIDWAISQETDLLQFMLWGPVPGTKLYQDYDAEGKMLKDIPWPEQHGQDEIWFQHSNFSRSETSKYLKEAFIKKYHTHGPAVTNMAHTAIKGYMTVLKETQEREDAGLVWDPSELKYVSHPNPQPDEHMKLRLAAMKRSALKFRPILSSAVKYAPNEESAEKGRMVIRLLEEVFGRPSVGDKAMETLVKACAVVESWRLKRGNGVLTRQPKMYRRTYPDRSESRSTVSPSVEAKAG